MIPLPDLLAALRWWFVLLFLGLLSAPLTFRLLRWLPDRGYAFSKMVGLLFLSYLFWLLSSLGYLANNSGGILMSLLVALVLPSAWILRHDSIKWRRWLGENRRYIVVVELLFATIFLFWVWVRAQNPAITGTEKPMEFAFLNGVGRSSAMPPLDPWLSGFAISYYYFGYVMTSVVARLAMVAEPLAFNLGIAWLTAGGALGAFGIVYNLLAGKGQELKHKALALALVAALAIPLAGNMQIVLEILHANGIGSAQFWAWLDVRDISDPPTGNGFGTDGPRFWWWWRSSRVIHEYHLSGRPEEGLEPIAEFPGFSFILGDMHPHVLALPFAFVSLGLALNWWLRRKRGLDQDAWSQRTLAGQLGLVFGQIGIPLWALTALLLGGLSFLNTWDVLIYLFVITGAYILNQWRQAGKWRWQFLKQGSMVAFLLAVPAILLYLPFYIGFRSQAGPPFLLPMLMRPTRLAHYLIIFGMPLSVALVLLGVLVTRQRRHSWRTALFSALAVVGALAGLMLLLGWIIAATPEGAARILSLADELGLSLAPLVAEAGLMARMLWATRAIVVVAPTIVAARLSSPWLILLLATIIGLVAMLWTTLLDDDQETDETFQGTGLPAEQPWGGLAEEANLSFALLLILTAALLTLGPEFVYLRDNFGQRLNTVFKFYYQAWLLFGVAAIYGLAALWRLSRTPALLATSAYGLMLVGALLFPVLAISSRAQEYAQPPTLNGMAHYRLSQPAELDALQWLRENVRGTPVIVEAVGGQYSPQGHGRVSASTGLPTLLGWAGHEFQWRGATPEPAAREDAVELIYSEGNWQETRETLDRYAVSYIYVGPLEESTYGPHVSEKFAGRLEVAYANENVIIYRWLPPNGEV